MYDYQFQIIASRRSGNLSQVQELVLNRHQANCQDDKGWTALHHAALRGQAEMAQFLISKGAIRNARNKGGRMPVDVAMGAAKTYLLSLQDQATLLASTPAAPPKKARTTRL